MNVSILKQPIDVNFVYKIFYKGMIIKGGNVLSAEIIKNLLVNSK